MAVTSLSGGIAQFNPFWLASTAPTIATGSWFLDAGGAKAWVVCQVPKTGTLQAFEFRTGAVISAQDLKVSWQDVDLTTGLPDGTADQYRVVAAASVVATSWITTGIMSSDGTDGGTKRSVTAGDYLAAVIEWNSSTGNVDLSYLASNNYQANPRHSSYLGKNAGKVGSLTPLFAIMYSDSTYGAVNGGNQPPCKTINATAFASNSTPDERGLYFIPEITMELSGVWITCNLSQANANVVLYDSDGTTALVTVALDKDCALENAANPLFVPLTATTLTSGLGYRLVVQPSTTTSITTYDFDVQTNARLGAVAGGINYYYTQRTDAGAWTETTTKRPWMGLFITGFAGGAAGGSSCVVIGG